jgi:hypothetical protein
MNYIRVLKSLLVQVSLLTNFFEKIGMKVESIIPNGYGNNYDKYFMSLTV